MDTADKSILGLLVAVIIAAGGWMFHTNAEFKVLQSQVLELIDDTETDQRQNETLKRHWQLLSWTRDEINQNRSKSGKPLVHWPSSE